MVRKKNKHTSMKITSPDGQAVKSPIRSTIEKMFPEAQTSFSPLGGIESDSLHYSAGKSHSGQKYNRRVNIQSDLNGEFSLWLREDDTEKTKRLKKSTDSCGPLSSPIATVENFGFNVSSRSLVKPARVISQRQVKGESAREHYQSQGFIVDDGVKTHWAHRQACLFGGKQVPENLDATSAASNQETWCLVERTVKELVQSDATQCSVTGKVYSTEGCPDKIEYTLKSDAGTAKITLDPRCTIKTSQKETQMMSTLIKNGLKGF
ncbi:MAG: hypothetical protein EBY16_03525 [Gammaproteobacteria bacterium]|nr:hypothetical protein [Gammaproteobacteria bacterium]